MVSFPMTFVPTTFTPCAVRWARETGGSEVTTTTVTLDMRMRSVLVDEGTRWHVWLHDPRRTEVAVDFWIPVAARRRIPVPVETVFSGEKGLIFDEVVAVFDGRCVRVYNNIECLLQCTETLPHDL